MFPFDDVIIWWYVQIILPITFRVLTDTYWYLLGQCSGAIEATLRMWVNKFIESQRNDIIKNKVGTTKPCVYFMRDAVQGCA